jgi:hypothetical protein
MQVFRVMSHIILDETGFQLSVFSYQENTASM